MAGKAHKTADDGPKRRRGAYCGRKADAKHESNKVRRENAKRAVRQGLADSNQLAKGGQESNEPRRTDPRMVSKEVYTATVQLSQQSHRGDITWPL